MASYKTGAEMHPTAKVETGIGWIAVTVGEGFYEVYLDRKFQNGARDFQTLNCFVKPGDHLVGVYSAGRWVVNETIHVPDEGETVPEPAAEEPAAELPEDEQPKEQPEPGQPEAGEPAGHPAEQPADGSAPEHDEQPALPEYILIKTETLHLLIDNMRALLMIMETLLPAVKDEPAPEG